MRASLVPDTPADAQLGRTLSSARRLHIGTVMLTDEIHGLCQSCGMPLHRDIDHGKDRNGEFDPDYCRQCFHEGRFTEPHRSMAAFIERFDRRQAAMQHGPTTKRVEGHTLIPKLKRWRDATP
jgi:hypothetical protein